MEQFVHIHGLEVVSWAPDVVFLSTHQGLIQIDGQGEWRYVSAEGHDFMGFSAHPSEPGTLYSSGHPAPGSPLRNPIGLMVSDDEGVTWSVRSLDGEADFHAMAVAPSNGDVVYGWNVTGRGGLYVSRDGGSEWEIIEGGILEEVGGAFSLAVRPENPDEVWAGTEAGLWSSTDSGLTWETVMGSTVSAVAFDPAAADRVVAYEIEGGLVASADGGQTWASLGLVFEDDAVAHIAVHPENPETIYVGTFGESLFRTSDGGSSWATLAVSGVPG